MNLQRTGIIVGIVAGIVAIWYYLRGTPDVNLVTYPNTQASGQPSYQNPATTYNIAAPSPAPSPSLIYGPPPPLPPTPGYMNFNTAPGNLLGLTKQGALNTPGTPAPGSPAAAGGAAASDSCGCKTSCGCGGCASTGGTYLDGSGDKCLSSNPAQQIRGGSQKLYDALGANIDSSPVGPNAGVQYVSGGDPVSAAAKIPAQAQAISQGQVGGVPAPGVPQQVARPLLTWAQYGLLTAINSGASETA